MQIHELNNFTGALGSGAYLAIDDGNDTGKISSQGLLAATEARIDNIIAGPAPSAEEIVDARLGADGVTYPSLGDAIRDQFTDVKSELSNIQDSMQFENYADTENWVDGKTYPSTVGQTLQMISGSASEHAIPIIKVSPNTVYRMYVDLANIGVTGTITTTGYTVGVTFADSDYSILSYASLSFGQLMEITTPASCEYIGVRIWALNDNWKNKVKSTFMLTNDGVNPKTYHAFGGEITEEAYAQISENQDDVSNLMNDKPNIFSTAVLRNVITPAVNGCLTYPDLWTNNVAITDSAVFSHVSQMVIDNGIAWIVSADNNTTFNDDIPDGYVTLTKVDIANKSVLDSWTVASVGTYDGFTFAVGAINPTINISGSNLLITFVTCIGTELTRFVRSFSISTETFVSTQKLQIGNISDSFSPSTYYDFTKTNFINTYAKSFNLGTVQTIFFNKIDYYNNYWWVWVSGHFNGCLLRSSDMVHWVYVASHPFKTNAADEITSCISSGYMYTAFRHPYKDGSMLITKMSMSDWQVKETMTIEDAASRPWIYNVNNGIELAHSCLKRNCTNIITIDTEYLRHSRLTLSIPDNRAYMCVVQDSADTSKRYICSTIPTSVYNSIRFTKFDIGKKSVGDILTKIQQLFGN